MLKKAKTEETMLFFVTFFSLVAFRLRGAGPNVNFKPPISTYYSLYIFSILNKRWKANSNHNITTTVKLSNPLTFGLFHVQSQSKCKQPKYKRGMS